MTNNEKIIIKFINTVRVKIDAILSDYSGDDPNYKRDVKNKIAEYFDNMENKLTT